MTASESRNESRHRSPRADSGFVMIEILMTLIITGMVVSVLSMAMIVTLDTNRSATDRVDGGVAVQGLTTFLPPDVDAARPGELDVLAATASGCPGTDPGENLLRLEWSENFDGIITDYVANYRFRTTADGGEIVRGSCSGDGTLGPPRVASMSALLGPTAPTVTTSDTNADGLADQVNFAVVTRSGKTVYVDAASKNPDETLPTTPSSPSTTVAPTTTTTTTTTTTVAPTTTTAGPTTTVAGPTTTTTTTAATTTTTAPPSCSVTGMAISPNPAKLKTSGVSKLRNDVNVTITVSGTCVGLNLQYTTGGPDSLSPQNFGSSAPYTVTFRGHPHGTEYWTVGPKTLQVHDGYGNILYTGTLTVTS